MRERINNPPTPKILINSIRQIGYSFESAVADIIDNSISVGSKNIDIYFPVSTSEEAYIAFVDDGDGMNRDQVINALKFGSNFVGERKENDLGRFGLGLKSASFSQCRKLTVVSKKEDILVAFGWDISEVENNNEWFCYEFKDDAIDIIPRIEDIKVLKNGTLVVWSDFDLVEAKLDDETDLRRQLSNNLELAREHISLVFHRYLNKKVSIRINNDIITGLDPFLENHLKTEKGKASIISLKVQNDKEHSVRIQPYTLPHYHDLSDKDRTLLGGANKMREGQGFYIYRKDRLIIHGTWFRIRVKSEVAKYAKIKVDIPNALDEIWDIDIKKQKAVIPQKLMVHFRKIIDDIRTRSEKKISHKKISVGLDENRIWNKKATRSGKESYYINLDARFIKEYISENFDEDNHSRVYRLLEVIGGAIPFDDIYNSVCNQSIDTHMDDERESMVIDEAIKMIKNIAKINNTSIEKALEAIAVIEPFNQQKMIDKIREAFAL